MTQSFDPLHLARGRSWRNRFMLAPLTNTQSHLDGTLSDEEIEWLVARARGGFGLVMTAAAYVAPSGKAWAGQLGISGDEHLPGLERLATALWEHGAVSSVQLHHGGKRADAAVSGVPLVSAFDEPAKGARALSPGEIEQVVADFAAAARRAEQAGFDGAEIHGAHGYLLTQFLEPRNARDDGWGGDYAGRTRIVREVIAAIRAGTGPDFQLGMRLSPERHGLVLDEMVTLAGEVMAAGELDYLDMSLWDVRKQPHEEIDRVRYELLLDAFTVLERHATRLGVAGAIASAADVRWSLDQGVDYVVVGKGAMVDHAFATHAIADEDYTAPAFPVGRDHLRREFLGERFVDYFSRGWPHLVAD